MAKKPKVKAPLSSEWLGKHARLRLERGGKRRSVDGVVEQAPAFGGGGAGFVLRTADSRECFVLSAARDLEELPFDTARARAVNRAHAMRDVPMTLEATESLVRAIEALRTPANGAEIDAIRAGIGHLLLISGQEMGALHQKQLDAFDLTLKSILSRMGDPKKITTLSDYLSPESEPQRPTFRDAVFGRLDEAIPPRARRKKEKSR